MKRAERRHHARRMKARVLNWQKQENARMDHAWGISMEYVVRHAEHRAKCSCWMCGNPRKWSKERTRKEDMDWNDDMAQ